MSVALSIAVRSYRSNFEGSGYSSPRRGVHRSSFVCNGEGNYEISVMVGQRGVDPAYQGFRATSTPTLRGHRRVDDFVLMWGGQGPTDTRGAIVLS